MLRAIGATQSQVRRIIVMEAGWMGLIGGLLGLFAGSVMAYHHVVYNTKLLTGWTFQFFYPYDVAGLGGRRHGAALPSRWLRAGETSGGDAGDHGDRL